MAEAGRGKVVDERAINPVVALVMEMSFERAWRRFGVSMSLFWVFDMHSCCVLHDDDNDDGVEKAFAEDAKSVVVERMESFMFFG